MPLQVASRPADQRQGCNGFQPARGAAVPGSRNRCLLQAGCRRSPNSLRAVPADPGMSVRADSASAARRRDDAAGHSPGIRRCRCGRAADGIAVESNHVYVIRPGHTLTIESGVLRLGRSGGAAWPSPPSVDDFFRPLARRAEGDGDHRRHVGDAGSNGLGRRASGQGRWRHLHRAGSGDRGISEHAALGSSTPAMPTRCSSPREIPAALHFLLAPSVSQQHLPGASRPSTCCSDASARASTRFSRFCACRPAAISGATSDRRCCAGCSGAWGLPR